MTHYMWVLRYINSLVIRSEEVGQELKCIEDLTEGHYTLEEEEIYGVWVEGGASLKLLISWSDRKVHITAYHDTTNVRILLIIGVCSCID